MSTWGSGCRRWSPIFCPKIAKSFCTARMGCSAWGPRRHRASRTPTSSTPASSRLRSLTGGAYFHHADSFAMMRGGHLDICVLGAFQVSAGGDLANWHTGAADAIPAVGGAMDLAIGAKHVFVMMDHPTKIGRKQDRRALHAIPLTGVACVNRIYTDLAVIDVTPRGPARRRDRRRLVVRRTAASDRRPAACDA